MAYKIRGSAPFGRQTLNETGSIRVVCRRTAVAGVAAQLFNCISCIAGGLTAVGGGALKSSIGLGGALAGTGALLVVSALLLARLRLSEGSAT